MRLIYLAGLAVLCARAVIAPADAQEPLPDAATLAAAASKAELAGHRDDPRDFEGVWVPASGRRPSAAAPGGPVIDKGLGTPPPAGAPQSLGGPTLGGAATVAASGSTLQCTPVWRLTGAGGGMSNLWIIGQHEILLLSEEDQDVARKIYLTAAHPRHLLPQPNGNSIGHWEGNTLVVDTIGFGDAKGDPIDRHVIERIAKQGDRLVDQAEIFEGNVADRRTLTENWRPDLHVWENVCEEGYDRYSVVNGKVVISNTSPDEDK